MKQYLAPIVAAGLVAGAGAGALAVSPALAQTTTSTQSSTTAQEHPAMGRFGFGFGFIGVGRIDEQAQLLGISSDDLLARIIKGQKLPDILKDLNITQADLTAKIKARHDQQIADLKAKVQALVTAGTITQAQADAYIQRITTPPTMPMFKGKMGHGGFRSMHQPATTPTPSS